MGARFQFVLFVFSVKVMRHIFPIFFCGRLWKSGGTGLTRPRWFAGDLSLRLKGGTVRDDAVFGSD
jgi:hypothetical protein